MLAYLTDARDGRRSGPALDEILVPGGVLLVSHSNELFDVFALNAGTARFFADALHRRRAAWTTLLPGAEPGATYNVRANPLTYADELAAHGLEELGRAYFNFHPLPPALLGEGDAGRIVDPDEIARVPEWKQQFQCSTLFSLSQRQPRSGTRCVARRSRRRRPAPARASATRRSWSAASSAASAGTASGSAITAAPAAASASALRRWLSTSGSAIVGAPVATASSAVWPAALTTTSAASSASSSEGGASTS